MKGAGGKKLLAIQWGRHILLSEEAAYAESRVMSTGHVNQGKGKRGASRKGGSGELQEHVLGLDKLGLDSRGEIQFEKMQTHM